MMSTSAKSETTDESALVVELKDPWLAALLGWLVPGMGHIYQGRTGKGFLFMLCILGTFYYGLYLGGGRVVYASTPSLITRWQYFCQLGVGLPAMPAFVQTLRASDRKAPLLGDNFMRPPKMQGPFRSTDESDQEVVHPDELAMWQHDLGDYFELGTVFTVIAGLLNVLAIYDAYGGPIILLPPDEKKNSPKSVEQSEAT
jgi:hypothetical protein